MAAERGKGPDRRSDEETVPGHRDLSAVPNVRAQLHLRRLKLS